MLKIANVDCGYFPFEPLAGQIVFYVDVETDSKEYEELADKANASGNAKKIGMSLLNDIHAIISKKELQEDWDEVLDGKRRLFIRGDGLMVEANKKAFSALFEAFYHEFWLYQGPQNSFVRFDGRTPKNSPLIQYIGTPTEMALGIQISNDDSEGTHEESWYEHFNLIYVLVPSDKATRDSLNNLAILDALNSNFAHCAMKVNSAEDLEEFGKFFQSCQGVQPIDRFIAVVTDPAKFTEVADIARKIGLRVSLSLPASDSVLDVKLP